MTEFGLPFDGVGLGDAANAPYSSAEWAHSWTLRHGVGSVFPNYGILKGTGSASAEPLAVLATNPASTNVEIQVGAALVNGRLYENTTIVTKAVGANASGNARIDTVILRIDFVAQTIRLVVLQGTPAASPVPPTLTQNASYWEIPLADIAVANGFATLAQSTITQRQRPVQSSYAGWQPYAVPLNFVWNGAYAAGLSIGQNGDAWAVPVAITGNMLVQSLIVHRPTIGNVGYNISWGFYTQDVNDGNVNENTLRLVGSVINSSGTTAGIGNIVLTATPAPFVLTPGLYWLVLRNDNAATVFSIGTIAASIFTEGMETINTGSVAALGQTIDLVTGFTDTNAFAIAVMVRGRVFGETVAFG